MAITTTASPTMTTKPIAIPRCQSASQFASVFRSSWLQSIMIGSLSRAFRPGPRNHPTCALTASCGSYTPILPVTGS